MRCCAFNKALAECAGGGEVFAEVRVAVDALRLGGEKENADSITSSSRNNKYRFLIIKHNLILCHAVCRPITKNITIAV